MTHPTRTISVPTLKEAVDAISDEEMARMCLCVNRMFGNAQAQKLMLLIVAARKAAAPTPGAALQENSPRCAKCGHLRSDHPYRHPFVGTAPTPEAS